MATSLVRLEAKRRWRSANKQRIAEYNAAYYAAHRDKLVAKTRTWIRENRDWQAASAGKASAQDRGAIIPASYNVASCIPFYAKARRLSRETGVLHEVDHIIPVSCGGEHTASNLQVLTKWKNRSKRAGQRTASN